MPPKRSQHPTRAMTTSTPTASKGIEGVYQALTAKENQPVVRSIAIFGVSLISTVFVSFFFLWVCGWRSAEAVSGWKILCGGKRKDGGIRVAELLEDRWNGERREKELRCVYFWGGQSRLGIALPALLPKTSPCHGREFLCVDLIFELNR